MDIRGHCLLCAKLTRTTKILTLGYAFNTNTEGIITYEEIYFSTTTDVTVGEKWLYTSIYVVSLCEIAS